MFIKIENADEDEEQDWISDSDLDTQRWRLCQ